MGVRGQGLQPSLGKGRQDILDCSITQPALDCCTVAQNLDMKDLVELVRDAVVAHAGQLASRTGDPDAHPPYIVLDLPCTFFMLSTHRSNTCSYAC